MKEDRMIGTIETQEQVGRVGADSDKEPLALGDFPSFSELSVDSELAAAVEEAIAEEFGGRPAELAWPELDETCHVRWGSHFRGREAVVGEATLVASGLDWMERTFDAVNRAMGVNGLANDSTWELRSDGSAVIRIWSGHRSVVAFVSAA